jgi:hypothetical protein
MIGIFPDKAREVYPIPEHHDGWTAMAIGYPAEPAHLPGALKVHDQALR